MPHWAGEGLRPLNPCTEKNDGAAPVQTRAVAAAVARPRAGRIMSAGRSPASGSARSATAVKALRASSAPLRPSVTGHDPIQWTVSLS